MLKRVQKPVLVICSTEFAFRVPVRCRKLVLEQEFSETKQKISTSRKPEPDHEMRRPQRKPIRLHTKTVSTRLHYTSKTKQNWARNSKMEQ
ncbi:unnamed protein product [Arctia plantaginis]|uniref:Uncharacterized protein n=1 Tax=Arctia plantaginis TaxID=874455 RepID=A0A8S1AP98_ARCPL|nr:unnamed protein product [Arctia plantaginis]CAB3248749.1 unnamed protein product [Arctia plantaginis]